MQCRSGPRVPAVCDAAARRGQSQLFPGRRYIGCRCGCGWLPATGDGVLHCKQHLRHMRAWAGNSTIWQRAGPCATKKFLILIKLAHTAIWVVMAAAIVAVPIAAMLGRFRLAGMAHRVDRRRMPCALAEPRTMSAYRPCRPVHSEPRGQLRHLPAALAGAKQQDHLRKSVCCRRAGLALASGSTPLVPKRSRSSVPKEKWRHPKVTPWVAALRRAYLPPKVKFTPAKYLKLFWLPV